MNFLEALNEFYKLKNDYDTKKQNNVNKILKDDNVKTMKQKQDMFQKEQIACISCKRRVGTIFSIKDGILSAICGDINKPCNLDIKINRGKYIFLDDLVDLYDTGVSDNKSEIIQIKLDLMFNYKSETTVLEEFKRLKANIVEDLESLTTYKTLYINSLTNIGSKSEINAKMSVFYNKVSTIQNTIREFDETGNIQLIKDVISLYRDELEPILMDLRKLKYTYQAVEIDDRDGTYHLRRNSYGINELMYEFDPPKVIKFTIGTDYNTTAAKTKVGRVSENDERSEYLL